jgi:effector-binding domain-containing protein
MLGGIVAREYHDGLVQLKELAESLPAADFSDLDVEHIVVSATDIAYLSTASSPDPAAIADALRIAYFRVLTFIDKNDLALDGAPLSITRNFNGAELAFDAGIPILGLTDATPRAGAGVKIGATYAGPVLRIKHIGSYKLLTDSHNKVSAYLAALGIERNGAVWESYVSDPGKVQERNLLTYLYYPIRVD